MIYYPLEYPPCINGYRRSYEVVACWFLAFLHDVDHSVYLEARDYVLANPIP